MIRSIIILIFLIIISIDILSQYDEMKSHIGFNIGINQLTVETKRRSKDPEVTQGNIFQVLALTYDHKLNNYLSLGTIISLQDTWLYDGNTGINESNYIAFFGLSGFYNYNFWNKIDLYSGIRTGYKYVKEYSGPSSNYSNKVINHEVGFQLIIIGLRLFSNERIGLNSEFAIGTPYFLSAGINYKFNKVKE